MGRHATDTTCLALANDPEFDQTPGSNPGVPTKRILKKPKPSKPNPRCFRIDVVQQDNAHLAWQTPAASGRKATRGCMCGYLGDNRRMCTCDARERLRYTRKMSGPLMDRVDWVARGGQRFLPRRCDRRGRTTSRRLPAARPPVFDGLVSRRPK
ncbi:MAG TPA: ATP-binding protein [Thermoanaerobaculia bacterium]|nr:ATP-binding protein [Thermoanaerobaculia bacterium]